MRPRTKEPEGRPPAFEVRSEFAAVEVSLDLEGNDPRLRVRDLESGQERCLDAFVLRSLALADAATLLEVCRRTIPVEE
ncbi:MAG: hypothetical protein IMW98_00760 [Firmicutes bacterium]|nr:hypothetical protein [Bacillota bacterium]